MFDFVSRKRIDIEARGLLAVLIDTYPDFPKEVLEWVNLGSGDFATLFCDNIEVLVVCSDKKSPFVALHCDRPPHGVHPRLSGSGAYQRVIKYFPRSSGPCERCGGSGWIDSNSSDGRQLTHMAIAMKMFRGIRLADDGYTPERLQLDEVRGTVTSFLSGDNPPCASAAGRADESRPGLFSKTKKVER